MPGFSYQEQLKLSVIVALLRRKIKKEWLQKLSDKQLQKLLPILVIFRAATLLNRPRTDEIIELDSIELRDKKITIKFKQDWLQHHPLTYEDLQSEAKYLKALDIEYLFA